MTRIRGDEENSVGDVIRDELIAAGRAKPHHVLPDSGWVSRVIRSADEIEDVVGLFRLSYQRLAAIGAPRKQDA
jgi:hypothetical protein